MGYSSESPRLLVHNRLYGNEQPEEDLSKLLYVWTPAFEHVMQLIFKLRRRDTLSPFDARLLACSLTCMRSRCITISNFLGFLYTSPCCFFELELRHLLLRLPRPSWLVPTIRKYPLRSTKVDKNAWRPRQVRKSFMYRKPNMKPENLA